MSRLLMVCMIGLIAATSTISAQEIERSLVLPYEGESKVKVRHSMDMDGMIMNENKDRLPDGCREISGDLQFTVHAGRKYAARFPGKMFAYDQQQWDVEPCSRITVKFVNDDHIRHQFMIHGLPEYLYPPTGMFTIEVTGPGSKTASFIVPSEPKTFLVHCELAQHMEKGMKAQMKVAQGDGEISSIPGLTPVVNPDNYRVDWTASRWVYLVLATLAGLGTVLGFRFYRRDKAGQ